jgi:hypothetical protein
VAGVFDSLQVIVKANDKQSIGLKPQNLARAYTCMQGAGETPGQIAKEARQVWINNPKSSAAEALLFIAGNMSFGRCGKR